MTRSRWENMVEIYVFCPEKERCFCLLNISECGMIAITETEYRSHDAECVM